MGVLEVIRDNDRTQITFSHKFLVAYQNAVRELPFAFISALWSLYIEEISSHYLNNAGDKTQHSELELEDEEVSIVKITLNHIFPQLCFILFQNSSECVKSLEMVCSP